jgi:hypothetical protein
MVRPDADQRGRFERTAKAGPGRAVARGEFCGVWVTSREKCITSGTIRLGLPRSYPRNSGQARGTLDAVLIQNWP